MDSLYTKPEGSPSWKFKLGLHTQVHLIQTELFRTISSGSVHSFLLHKYYPMMKHVVSQAIFSSLILLDFGDVVKCVSLDTRYLTRFYHISHCGPSWCYFRTKVLSHPLEIYISSLAYIQLWPHQNFLHKAPRIPHPTLKVWKIQCTYVWVKLRPNINFRH